jgi:WD40 repeat protein
MYWCNNVEEIIFLKNNYFFVMSVCVLVQSLCGMEDAQKLKVKSLNCIQRLCEVYCLTGSQILIRNNAGCSIIDSQLDQKITDITPHVYSIRVMPDKKTMFFCCGNTIYKYHIETRVCEYCIDIENSAYLVACNQYNSDLFLSIAEGGGHKRLRRYDYGKKDYGKDNIKYEGSAAIFIMHPEKPIISMMHKNEVSLYDAYNLKKKLKTFTLDKLIDRSALNKCFLAVINSNYNVISIIDLLKEENVGSFPILSPRNCITQFLFYLDEPILVTISFLIGEKQEILHYWDIRTKKSIYSMVFPGINNIFDLSFFSDGKQLVVAEKNGCSLYAVPFKVRCELIKEKLPLFLCVLRSAIEQQKQGVQQDVFRLLCNFLYCA